jgi:hypothetical protein
MEALGYTGLLVVHEGGRVAPYHGKQQLYYGTDGGGEWKKDGREYLLDKE